MEPVDLRLMDEFQRDLPRPAFVDVLAGKRRGGKTWVKVACVVLAAVAVPQRRHPDGLIRAFVGWLVVPSYPEQREMHEDLQSSISYAGGRVLADLKKVNYVILGGENAGEHLFM